MLWKFQNYRVGLLVILFSSSLSLAENAKMKSKVWL